MSGFPSSFPLCSSPLVQAQMLALGLVLVGLPYRQRQCGGIYMCAILKYTFPPPLILTL